MNSRDRSNDATPPGPGRPTCAPDRAIGSPVHGAPVEPRATSHISATSVDSTESPFQLDLEAPATGGRSRNAASGVGAVCSTLIRSEIGKRTSSFFTSLLVHVAIILALALWMLRGEVITDGLLVLQRSDAQLAHEPGVTLQDPMLVQHDLHDSAHADSDWDESALALDQLLAEMADSLRQQTDAAPVWTPSPHRATPQATFPTGGGLEGRSLAERSRLATLMGGTPQSEAAVELGLRWLINHQHHDGGWRFDFRSSPCRGRCRHSGSEGSTIAATGLALMCFLGSGYTHQQGEHQQVVARGLEYLLQRLRETPHGGMLMENTLYDQGIATIVLCEAYTLTGDPQLREPAQAAVNYVVSSQHPGGGWRYNPGQPGDMTVTGWQLMALRSAEVAGLQVPHDTWRSARRFLDSMQSASGAHYGYTSAGQEPSPTAIGLLLRMYQGWPLEYSPLEHGENYLAARGPSPRDVYFNYYATLVLHHRRTERWPEWNQQMRDYLVTTQGKEGHEAGSWYFDEQHNRVGGRLYTTAMSIMTLQVYYRYLPLYERGTDVGDRP